MSKFQMKKLSLACGLALGTLGLTPLAQAQVGATDVFMSGATAQNINLGKAMESICGAGSTKIYSGGSLNNFHWFCPTNTVGIAGTLSVAKESNGGSGNGVAPVNNSTNLIRPYNGPNVGGTTCTTRVAEGPFTTVFQCPTLNSGNQAPTAGLSDVEPRLLATAANVGNLAAGGVVAVQFGVAVNNALATRLAAIPGRATTGLRSAELRGIMSNTLVDWTQIDPAMTPNGSGTTAVKFCRRSLTSGTQKSFEVRMLGQSCAGALTANSGALNATVNNVTDDSPNNNTGTVINTGTNLGQGGYRGYGGGGFTVVMNSNAEDVDACLTAAENNGELAVGLLSLERAPGAANDDPDGIVDLWQYVNMDGIAPTLTNFLNGTWENLWTQATFNRRLAGYTVNQTTLMNSIQSKMGDPAIIIAEGQLGVAGLPSNGYTWTGALGNPVVPTERRTTGGDVNNCQEALFQ